MALYRVRCCVCRKGFTPLRNDAQTCSSRCRQKAYRKRLSVTRGPYKSVTHNLLFSSKTDLWSTPQSLFDELDLEFGFTMDVCALPENAKCPQFYSPLDDGLRQPWRGVCWMNPPYGKTISRWVAKAYEAAKGDAMVVALLPARTDTRWWQDYVTRAREVRFLRGRLRFSKSKHAAPFPSAVVIFSSGQTKSSPTGGVDN